MSSAIEDQDHVNKQFLDIVYLSADPQRTEAHTLPDDVKTLFHAVQLSNKHVIISFESKQTRNNLVSEISAHGDILRSFMLSPARPRSTASIYLCVNDEDGVYIAESYSNEILYFDTKLKRIENLSLVSTAIPPARLCFSADDHHEMLFVGTSRTPGIVSILFKKKSAMNMSLRFETPARKMYQQKLLSEQAKQISNNGNMGNRQGAPVKMFELIWIEYHST